MNYVHVDYHSAAGQIHVYDAEGEVSRLFPNTAAGRYDAHKFADETARFLRCEWGSNEPRE